MLRKILAIGICLVLFATICNSLTMISTGASKKNVSIDIVFCIDLTASMWDDIDEVCDSTTIILESIRDITSDFRIGFIGYRDIDYDSYPFERFLFSSDTTSIQANISLLPDMVSGGGDIPESVYEGLYFALNMPWRNNVVRTVILMGDAPPKTDSDYHGLRSNSSGESYDEVTEDEINELKDITIDIDTIANLNSEKGSHIYPIVIASDYGHYDEGAITAFDEIANRTNGKRYDAENANEVPEAVMKAITEAVDEAKVENEEDKTEYVPFSNIWPIIGLFSIITMVIVVIVALKSKKTEKSYEIDPYSPRCSYCGGSTRFIRESQQYYCYYCDIYITTSKLHASFTKEQIPSYNSTFAPTPYIASQIPQTPPPTQEQHEHRDDYTLDMTEQNEIEDWTNKGKRSRGKEKFRNRNGSKFCPDCGTLGKASKFCPECGEKLLR